ncbi:MAG TPA: hypothetical protein VKC66_29460 [Xanthobacteraceae bacterium]|nr:hypothetical protein [Xanthobacteraceae bacterium]
MEFVADARTTEDGSLHIRYVIDGRRELLEPTRNDPLVTQARVRFV